MNWMVFLAGVIGILLAGFGFVSLAIDAKRHRHYGNLVVAVLVAVAVVTVLIAFGDRLVQ